MFVEERSDLALLIKLNSAENEIVQPSRVKFRKFKKHSIKERFLSQDELSALSLHAFSEGIDRKSAKTVDWPKLCIGRFAPEISTYFSRDGDGECSLTTRSAVWNMNSSTTDLSDILMLVSHNCFILFSINQARERSESASGMGRTLTP